MAQDDALRSPAHPLIESDHIEGTAVYDADGKRIGTIKRLVIEKVSGHVAYQPVDEVLNWSSTHNIWRTKLRATALRSRSIAEQGLRQRAAKDHVAVPSCSRWGVRAHSARMRCCASAP